MYTHTHTHTHTHIIHSHLYIMHSVYAVLTSRVDYCVSLTFIRSTCCHHIQNMVCRSTLSRTKCTPQDSLLRISVKSELFRPPSSSLDLNQCVQLFQHCAIKKEYVSTTDSIQCISNVQHTKPCVIRQVLTLEGCHGPVRLPCQAWRAWDHGDRHARADEKVSDLGLPMRDRCLSMRDLG